MASIHTNRFLNEGGFTQEFDDIMEDNTLEGSIKKNQAKLLQRQVKYYWIPILISAISLIISLSVMIFK